MDIHIREQSLPGIGHRYELDVDAGRKLTVVVQQGGGGRSAWCPASAKSPMPWCR